MLGSARVRTARGGAPHWRWARAARSPALLFAPTTVVGSTLLDTVAPRGTVTEAFAAMVMGIVAGTAVGNAVGGAIVESVLLRDGGARRRRIALAGSALAIALRRRRTLA